MKVRIHDLSLGGCLIEASSRIEIGRRISLQLDLPGEGSLSIQGETVRAQEPSRYAVKFVDMDQRKLDRLERALERMLRWPSARSAPGGAASID